MYTTVLEETKLLNLCLSHVECVVEVVVESRRTRRRGVDFVHVSNHVSHNVSQRALAMYVNYPHRGIM